MTKSHLSLISTMGKQEPPSGALRVPRLLISEAQDDWRAAVEDRLQELIRLDQGWDGYQGQPLSFTNAVFAYQMLESICNADTPAPQIVPGQDGDLQVEWHTLKGDIELDVRGPNHVLAWRLVPNEDPDGEELYLKNDFRVVANWVNDLTEPVIAPIATAA